MKPNLNEEEIKQGEDFRDKKKSEDPDNPLTKRLIEMHPEDEAVKKFKDPKLLNLIEEELSKDHLGDTSEKMTAFISVSTSQLDIPELRQSVSIGGDSAVGKDNLMKTVLKHFPPDKWIFLTNATQSTLEDDIADKDVIAFSEVNLMSDNGANKHLLEIIKQLAEGGTHALKKDVATGYRSIKNSRQPQKTLIFSTVEEKKDEQMDTRFTNIVLSGSLKKNKVINDSTLTNFADLNKIFEKTEEKPSWICLGISGLKKYPVWVPYADLIKDSNIFDNRLTRSKRDVKRIMALACAIVWLYQLQRNKIIFKGKEFLISEPQDFLNAVLICSKFFNETYSGLEPRLQEILDAMPKDERIARDVLQKKLGIKGRNTIKKRLGLLSNMGYVQFVEKAGNEVYWKKLSDTCQKPLIEAKIDDLIKKFEDYEFKFDSLNDIKLIACEDVNEEDIGCQRLSKDIKKLLFNLGYQEENNTVGVEGIEYKQNDIEIEQVRAN